MKTTTFGPNEIGRFSVNLTKLRRTALKCSLLTASVAVLGIGGAKAGDVQGQIPASQYKPSIVVRSFAHPGRMDNQGVRRRATTKKVVYNHSQSKPTVNRGRIGNRGVRLLVRSKQRVVRFRVKRSE